MKKLKITGIVLACITAVILAGIGGYYLMGEKIHIESGTQAVFEFHYEGVIKQTHITQTLTEEETERIRNILDGKWALPGGIIPLFGEEVSIYFGNTYYCFSCDGDRFFRLNDQELYIKISKDEMDEIHRIVEKYGGYFPCI